MWSIFKRRRRDVAENGWNDDGCGKKVVFPEEKVRIGFETFLKKRGFLENGKCKNFESYKERWWRMMMEVEKRSFVLKVNLIREKIWFSDVEKLSWKWQIAVFGSRKNWGLGSIQTPTNRLFLIRSDYSQSSRHCFLTGKIVHFGSFNLLSAYSETSRW